MLLLCDCGGTKSDWLVCDKAQGKIYKHFQTSGINPVIMSLDEIERTLNEQLIPQIKHQEILELEFYGAGCTSQQSLKMIVLLSKIIPDCENIKVSSDLLGAAKALCGRTEGIAAILGTGSNSCLYNGTEIVQSTPALGYVLGDEGSGAVLGRIFLNALLKGLLPEKVAHQFKLEINFSQTDIIEKVYHANRPNSFLASLSSFIYSQLDVKEVRYMVIQNFQDFFKRNIAQYNRPDLPVNFVGSIAFYYSKELEMAAQIENFKIGKVLKSPLEGLFTNL